MAGTADKKKIFQLLIADPFVIKVMDLCAWGPVAAFTETERATADIALEHGPFTRSQVFVVIDAEGHERIAFTSAAAVLTGTALPICFVTSPLLPTNSKTAVI